MNKREIIIGALIAVVSTFSGVFLAFFLEGIIAQNNNIKFANGFINIQKDFCNAEYEALKSLEITETVIELPSLESATILSGFIQLFIENIDLSTFKKLQQHGVELKKINQHYSVIKKQVGPPITIVGKPPHMSPQQWEFDKKTYAMITKQRNLNLVTLRELLSSYKKEVKLVCETLTLLHVKN